MSFLHATAATVRTFQRLKSSVSPVSSAHQYSLHLLTEILADEGHATDMLRASSLTSAQVEDELSKAVNADHLNSESRSDEISFLDWQRSLMRLADRIAIEFSEDGFTGSEHILMAVVQQDSGVSELLSACGLTEKMLLADLENVPPEMEIPVGLFVQIRPAEQGHVDAASLARILDASANRCREGLRVIEDYVRFHLDDAILQRELKQIRHQLTQTLTHLGQQTWVPGRDTLNDVGPSGTLATERSRSSLIDVVRANLKRVEESLRSLEEYGKLIDAELALKISECRYRMYTVEKGLETVSQNRKRLEQCRLYLLVTETACRYSPEILIKNSLETGVDVIQIREKTMTDQELIAYGLQVREWTAAAGALLIMNDRADIAVAIGADGVHLGQEDMEVNAARKVLGGQGIIGVSTHDLEQAKTAVFAGADYLGVGPVFQSQTKEFEIFAGLDYVEAAANNLGLPWFAIGGINTENLRTVLQAGARRVAVSSVISQAPHPRGVAEEMKSMLNSAVKIDELRAAAKK